MVPRFDPLDCMIIGEDLYLSLIFRVEKFHLSCAMVGAKSLIMITFENIKSKYRFEAYLVLSICTGRNIVFDEMVISAQKHINALVAISPFLKTKS